GVEKDPEFLKAVYDTLFTGIRVVLAPETAATQYTLSQLWDAIPMQLATIPKSYRDIVNRQLRRTYETYQKTSEQAQAHNLPCRPKRDLDMAPTDILLLTNRDSDNIGDQIIEASVISLIKAAAANLGLDTGDLKIRSRAASLISRKYMSTRDESLLEPARRAISRADVVVFGGAPLFNYRYQSFYLRTIRTIELAQEYGVPVLFSSIGVEPYSET